VLTSRRSNPIPSGVTRREKESAMKLINALYLAIAAALIAIAFIGTGSASAVTVCKVEGDGGKKCTTGNLYPPRVYKAVLETGTKVEFINLPTLKCTSSTVFGKTTLMSAEPLPGELTSLTFTGEDCTKHCESVTALNLSYVLKIKYLDGKKDGEVILTKNGAANPPILKFTKCGFFATTCEFTAQSETFVFKLVGGNPVGKLVANEAPFLYSGGTSEEACGSVVKYKATYQITEPAGPVFITELP
jgi:hypothetical protein